MKRTTLFFAVVTLAFLFGGVTAVTTPTSVAASPMGTTFPCADEESISGFDLLAADSYYTSKDYLLTGTDGSTSILNTKVAGVELPKTDCEVDLGESTFYSTPTYDYIQDRVFTNNTYNAGTSTEETAGESNPTVNNEMASQSAGTQLYAKVTFGDNESAYQYTDFKSTMSYDYNNDGDFADALDRSYNPFITESDVWYGCVKADWSNASDTGYVLVQAVFEVAGAATDYTVQAKIYPGDGDSDWSDDDASGENQITMTYYSADADWIAWQWKMADLLENDAGDSPTLEGLDYFNIRIYHVGAGNVQFYARNLCWFDEYKGLTDNTDDGTTLYDMDSTGGVPGGLWDDDDLLASSITDTGSASTYDSTVPLENKVTNGYELGVPARLINFEGIAQIDIADNAAGSDNAAQPVITSVWDSEEDAYLTTVYFEVDTLPIDALIAPTTYWAFSNFQHNMTLKESVLASGSYDAWEEDLVSYTFEYTTHYSDVKSAWDAADSDPEEVQYDHTDPSTSTGALHHVEYSFYTLGDWSGTVEPAEETTTAAGGGGPAPSVEEKDNTALYLVGGFGLLIAGAAVLYIAKKR